MSPPSAFIMPIKKAQEKALESDSTKPWFYILIFHNEALTFKLTMEETDNFSSLRN